MDNKKSKSENAAQKRNRNVSMKVMALYPFENDHPILKDTQCFV